MRLFSCLFLIMSVAFSSNAQEIWPIDSCIAHALDNNIDLAIQDKSNELNDLQVRQSKMDFGPNINAQIDYTQAFGRSIDITTNTYRNQNTLNNQYFLTGSIDVFNGLTKWNTLKQSKLMLESGDLNRHAIEESIQLDILTNYLLVLRAKEQLQQAVIQKTNNQEQFDRTQAMVDEGVLPANELITLEAQLANDNILITTYRNQIELGLTNLKLTMRLDPNKSIDIVVPELPDIASIERTLESMDGIYGHAVKNRPEVKSAQLNETLADYDTKIAKGAQYPTISTFASIATNYSDQFKNLLSNVEFETQTIGTLAEAPFTEVVGTVPVVTNSFESVPFFEQLNNNLNYAIGVSLNIPIFNRGVARLNIQRSEIMAEQSRLLTEQTKQALYNTIQQAYSNALAAIETYNAAEVNLDAAQRSLDSEKSRLEGGVGTNLEYNIASNNWTIASSRLIEAKYDYMFNIKYLDFYQGKPIKF